MRLRGLEITFLGLFIQAFAFTWAEKIEEFFIYGPMELHQTAMNKFMEMRKADPSLTMGNDGEFMKLANEHAIRRLRRKPDEELVLRRNSQSEVPGLEFDPILQLPSPAAEDVLSSAVNEQTSSSNQLMLPHEARAMAVQFNEEIGLGAISKAGALPLGAEGQWLEFAEKKLKHDEALDYQGLLWELGSEVAERQFMEQGGFNLTHEEDLLRGLEEWFVKGGGKLHFAKPVVSKEHGFQLVATEETHEFDPIISCPMKLIMCKQTARNVLVSSRGKYLGEELQKTFEKDEVLGMVIFVLHEYYKEIAAGGSKWGPFLRTLRMRYLATSVLHELRGTMVVTKYNHWMKQSDNFMWWSVGADGPCSPTTGICKTKPLDRGGDSRFNIHQIRWAYWVVKQNAVRVKQIATGLEFIALIPFYHMVEKSFDARGGITFDLDGTISVRAGQTVDGGQVLSINPGPISDSEYFLRYFNVPHEVPNPQTEIKLKLPGVIPKGSKFHYCLKGTQKEQNRDDCKASYRSESMFWKSKVLTEWRQLMNLPPRMQELRMWATRLHLYGGQEEMALLSSANSIIAGLPIPVDQMPAEEQLMLLGLARDNIEASVMAAGGGAARPPPQLYSAPDPTEDYEADRAMQHLATLAVQAQRAVAANNLALNATRAVMNRTRDFFQHGVLPMAGLDELDHFLLKKIGMLAHCGFENDMKITHGNVSEELFCAMRVHLMNEEEIHVFCPAEARVWEDNCLNVEFMNYTAISERNEKDVISALRGSLQSLLSSYPTTMEEDLSLIRRHQEKEGPEEQIESTAGKVTLQAYFLRYREKDIIYSALNHLELHEEKMRNGSLVYQIEMKAQERREADLRTEEHKKFIEKVKAMAAVKNELAVVEVNMGETVPKANLTLLEGGDLVQTVQNFCRQHRVPLSNAPKLEQALRAKIRNPPPLQLILGVVTPLGERRVLSIAEGANETVATGVFCARYDNTPDVTATPWCQQLLQRVRSRLHPEPPFNRRVLVSLPVDAPDGRKLLLVVREGEQHDLLQFVFDFLDAHSVQTSREGLIMLAEEVNRRLPGPVLQLPVGLTAQRSVSIRFAKDDNVTNVVEGFANFFDIEPQLKLAVLKKARQGMAPGTFLV
eukprot:gene3198-3501_t